jgi:Flp pilus assembly protein TadG
MRDDRQTGENYGQLPVVGASAPRVGVRRPRLRSESGQALVLLMGSLPVLFTIALLVLDAGNGFVQRRASQNAADAAALAAADSLPDVAAATSIAQSYAGRRNPTKVRTDAGGNATLCESSSATNCITVTSPYKGDPARLEVKVRENVHTFFGGVVSSLLHATGLASYDVSARAVGTFGRGPPPAYNFVSFNKGGTSCGENHTLVIRSSGQLTVTNAIYADSCNSPDDAFDVFGPGGFIAAPDIRVVGGWETHAGAGSVRVGGVQCPLLHSSLPLGAPQPGGCPATGQPVLDDPFAGKITSQPPGRPPGAAHRR